MRSASTSGPLPTTDARPFGEIATGPKGWPFLGVLLEYAKDPLPYLMNVRAEHGDVAVLPIGGRRIAMLSRPSLVDTVLVKAWRSTHKHEIYRRLEPLLGKGLVTAEGDLWKRNRQRAAPSFARKHIATYADAMVACARRYVADRTPGETRDLHEDMMALTQAIVLETLFGADLDVDTTPVAHAVEVVMEQFVDESRSILRMLPAGWPTPGRRRAAAAVTELDAVMRAIIAARREAGLGDDLLSRLIDARDDDGGGLDDDQLRDEAVTLFMAGHETTAAALSYTQCWLAEHPHAAERLYAEVAEVLDGDRPATVADVARLPFTTAAIKESMRLSPPAWMFGREVVEPFEADGVAFEKGTQIIVPVYVIHRDAALFDDPLAFRPERWLDGLEDRLPRGAYLPFGGGPRVCIGNHFAMMEAVLVLAEIVRAIRLTPADGFPALRPSITLRPAGAVPATVTAA